MKTTPLYVNRVGFTCKQEDVPARVTQHYSLHFHKAGPEAYEEQQSKLHFPYHREAGGLREEKEEMQKVCS